VVSRGEERPRLERSHTCLNNIEVKRPRSSPARVVHAVLRDGSVFVACFKPAVCRDAVSSPISSHQKYVSKQLALSAEALSKLSDHFRMISSSNFRSRLNVPGRGGGRRSRGKFSSEPSNS
jgi:hypothetical protein